MVSAFTQRHSWAHSVRASALLKEAAAITDTEALRTASAADIHANQDRLASAFSELRHRHPDRHIIFDGHSLIDNDEGLVVVPTATFVQLAPNMIVFLEDVATTILARRLADVERVRPHRSAEEIAAHQHAAMEAAMGYSAALSVPCLIIRSGDSMAFDETLEREFVGSL